MRFPAVEDIPDIDTKRVNIKTLDPLLNTIVENTRFALRHRHNFKVMPPLYFESELIALLRTQLTLFAVTHKSIRILLRRAYREPDKRLVSDAASLVREQIEKLYVVALLLDNPARWIRRHLRHAFKSDVEEFLLSVDEFSSSPRLQELITKQFPEFLKSGQRPKVPGKKTITIISDFAYRTLRHHLTSSGPDPTWFKDHIKRRKKKSNQELRTYIRDYFDFPTPGRAIRLIRRKRIKPFLLRWYKEYSFICQYTHVGEAKSMIAVMSEFKDWRHAEMVDIYAQKLAGKLIFTNHAAAASACAIIIAALVDDYGTETEVQDYWRELYTRALPAKVLWNIYIKDLF